MIDDLTVQNKKLKRRLKQYEKLHDAHLKDEKLFEVRVHGLPTAKKNELEDMLRKFALGLSDQPAQSSSSISHMYQRVVPGLRSQATNTTNSTAAADSAYASASASGQGSSAPSGASANGRSKNPFKSSLKSRHQNIHTYLHDIPEGLLPQQATAMSDKTKKKLVVRRLEQIFAGKGAVKGDHHHPLQQQEVSQLAAKADRFESEALGKLSAAEGNREARIMKNDPESEEGAEGAEVRVMPSVEPSPQAPAFDSTLHISAAQKTAEHDFADKCSSPDQRPTRPLDLDPQRAQVPADNMLYIRHLGFSPPDVEQSPEEGHGWIYLNLLINMAQLHTINVTPEFVKTALQDYSTRFELSEDGRKVRWRRNVHHLRPYRDTEESSASPDVRRPQKRVKLSDDIKDSSSDQNSDSRQKSLRQRREQLSYTPLFFHHSSDESDVSSSSDEESMESPYLVPQGGGVSSAMTSSGGRQTHSNVRALSNKAKRKRGNGPIIFYNNAKFCTDLSGDQKTEEAMTYNHIMYHVATKQPVGDGHATEVNANLYEKKGPLNDSQELGEPMDHGDNTTPLSMEIKFPPQTPLTSGSERSPFEMEASGIGGVHPADNFAINVKTQHSQMDVLAPQTIRQQVPGRYPDHLTNILMGNGESSMGRSAFHKEVLSTKQQNLPPSELPPASHFISLEETDSEYGSDDESAMSISPDALNIPPPSAAPQLMQMPSWSSDESASDDNSADDNDGDDVSDDGSLDFLATAREIDPESIRAQEREYDANMAERLADEIPAGSSAATAGGGSGFASPASGVDPEEVAEARRIHKEKSAKASLLKRARTGDSLVVNGR